MDNSLSRTTHISVVGLLLALALLSVAIVIGWMSSVTYVAVAVLLIMTVAVVINTWRNGQATGSLAQTIHEVDHTTPRMPTRKNPYYPIQGGSK
jgi:hypothetical protein